jgi:hypothetical protein
VSRLRPGAAPALVAAGLCVVATFLYAALLSAEGNGFTPRVALFTGLIGVAALMCAGAAPSALAPAGLRSGLLAAATSLLLVLGSLGIFSIGLPLLVAAGFSGTAAVRAGEGRPLPPLAWTAAGLPVAAALVAVGLVLTQRA